jgi:kynurenine formamidase
MSGPHQSARHASDVADFHQTLSNWQRWGEHDQLGTLNLITAEKRAAAAALVRSGRVVSCARPIPTEAGPSNPEPAVHRMIGTHREGWGADSFSLASHGYATTHLDALCHIFYQGRLYNGYSSEHVTPEGALELSVDALRHGIVSRGVLLDVPAAKGKAWLEPGEPIHPADLEETERKAAVRVESGDILLVRTGRFARVAAHGDWNPRELLAGLHADCLPWLHERGVAALGSDGVSDVHPSGIDDVRLPIHVVGIVAMGLSLLDNLDLEALAAACREEKRGAFLLTIAPLVLSRGTASPVNPIALF